MNIVVYFSEAGAPKTGLSPTLDGWEMDGTHTIDAQGMTEIAGGFYYYTFSAYDESVDYVFGADGGVALADEDRYKFGSNEMGQVTEDLTDIKGTGFVKDTDSLVDIRPETDKIQDVLDDTDAMDARLPDDPADQSEVEAAITATEGNIRGSDSDDLKAISDQLDTAQADLDNPDQYKANVSALALEANVEGHVTTALGSYDPPTKAELDTAVANLTTEIDANETKIDTITTAVTRILGLVQENFRLKDQVYDSNGNLTSATIRIYGSAADCNNDENAIAEYTLTATYNAVGECTSYKVVKA